MGSQSVSKKVAARTATTVLPEPLYLLVRENAERHGRTVSQELRLLIAESYPLERAA